MLKRLMTVTMLSLLATATMTTPLAAHDEYRIVGSVVKLTATQIDVKQIKDGKIIKVAVNKQTKLTRDKKPVAISELKVGGSVVVDAIGDSIEELLALDIRLVPAIPVTQKPK